MNNKGFTVVELIASFALTMVIAVLLFEVLIEVKDVFADTNIKTAIQQKSSIISKNIENLLNPNSNNINCNSNQGMCTINDKILQIKKNNNQIIINGQNFNMPKSVEIKDYQITNYCDDKECYLYVEMILDSANIKNEYIYNVTYYYLP